MDLPNKGPCLKRLASLNNSSTGAPPSQELLFKVSRFHSMSPGVISLRMSSWSAPSPSVCNCRSIFSAFPATTESLCSSLSVVLQEGSPIFAVKPPTFSSQHRQVVAEVWDAQSRRLEIHSRTSSTKPLKAQGAPHVMRVLSNLYRGRLQLSLPPKCDRAHLVG